MNRLGKHINIAIIPARGGSKRFPGKNITDFGGKPLLAHSIEYAHNNKDIVKRVIVSTDSEEIKKIAWEYGAEVMERPEAISGDHSPTSEALQHVVQELDEPVENVILLQPTNPLRPESLLRNAYEVFRKKELESLFTVSENKLKLGSISGNRFHPYNYKYGQRSQDIEPLYFENGLLYIAKVSLIEKGILLNANSFPYVENHPFAAIDIDIKDDLIYANKFLTYE